MNIKQLDPRVLEGKLAQLNRDDLNKMSDQSMALLHQAKSYGIEFEESGDLSSSPSMHRQLYANYHQQLHQLAEKMTFKLLLKRIFRR